MPAEDTWRSPNDWCGHTQDWHADDDQATETEVTELVAAFARALQPETAVEVGTWTGQTTAAIGRALQANGHGHLYAVEISHELAEQARQACKGLPVTVTRGSSTEWTPPWNIDFAFVDGASDRCAEVEYLLDRMSPGAIVGVHDTGPLHVSGRMDALNANPRLRVITLRTPRGVSFAEVLKTTRKGYDAVMVSLDSANPIQLVTQDGTASGAPTVVDLDIPTGTAVLGSGVQGPQSDGGLFCTSGPHPTDATLWRFNVSSPSYSTPYTCWMIVANAT